MVQNLIQRGHMVHCRARSSYRGRCDRFHKTKTLLHTKNTKSTKWATSLLNLVFTVLCTPLLRILHVLFLSLTSLLLRLVWLRVTLLGAQKFRPRPVETIRSAINGFVMRRFQVAACEQLAASIYRRQGSTSFFRETRKLSQLTYWKQWHVLEKLAIDQFACGNPNSTDILQNGSEAHVCQSHHFNIWLYNFHWHWSWEHPQNNNQWIVSRIGKYFPVSFLKTGTFSRRSKK